MSNYVNPMSLIAATPMTQNKSSGGSSWFQALAQAWGEALDSQASVIQQKSDAIATGGTDNPSAITELTTESLRMSFLSNSSNTSISTVGQALETMARKG
ncbi:hypothetical protein [Aquabacterium sp.]|uniref:hypothetical protein n=1 Tax=Aquabacterium sp. TaxID=1872578 RepID=UPI002C98D6EA|nr:hypothetical protein [Aquabacterium sp.]HSW05255.1 hypothetical protein [Aquabacterium sp.]